MSTELQERLELGAGRPRSAPDVQSAWVRGHKLRTRRRVMRGAGAALAACLLFGGGYAIVSGSGNQPPGRRSIASTGSGDRASGFDFSVPTPAGWTKETQSLSPGITAPAGILVASTFSAPAAGTFSRGCSLLPPAEVLANVGSNDALVWVFEAGAPETGVSRPARFDASSGAELPCGAGPLASGVEGRWFPFTDSGRDVYAVVVVGANAGTKRAQAYELLNSLQFNGEPPTVTLPPTTAPPAPIPTVVTTHPYPATTATSNPGQPADAATDALIRKAVLGWLKSPTTNDLSPYVEDFASIKAAELQGAAQHSAAQLSGYSGQVDSVSVIDANTAQVRYTLLDSGAAIFGSLPGTVVKINGQWMVSRQTACDMLARGNVQCPVRGGS